MMTSEIVSQEAKDSVRKLKEYYVFHPDFPKKGINFWDVFALTKNKSAFDLLNSVIDDYGRRYRGRVDVVVGLEARGFLFGPLLARALDCTFVAMRKQGKLPGDVIEEKYILEYAEDIIEAQKDSIKPGQQVLIFDDCIATGGTLSAAYNLVQRLGGHVVECLVFYNIQEVESCTKFPVTVLLD